MSEENSNVVAPSEPAPSGPVAQSSLEAQPDPVAKPASPEEPSPAPLEADGVAGETVDDVAATADETVAADAGAAGEEADAAEEAEAAGDEQEDDEGPRARWYAIHVYSGFEQKVLKNIQYRLDIDDLNDFVARLLVPTHNVIEIKDGKKVQSQKNLMPGYVLIEMLYNEDVIDTITKLGGVAGFVGDGTKPTAMSDEQVEGLLAQTSHRQDKPKAEVLFDKGEQVKIIEGPFAGFTGQVSEIDATRGKLSVMVSIFGRQTAVELDVLQVDKV